MDYIYNITFVCAETDAPAALEYIRVTVIPALLAGPATGARLARVHTNANEAVSYALEVHLPDFHSVRPWRDTHMRPCLGTLTDTWGERLMYFDTILSLLPLENS